MAHDGTSVLAVKAFKEMGAKKVWNAGRIIIPFDHIAPANNETAAKLQKSIRQWIQSRELQIFPM